MLTIGESGETFYRHCLYYFYSSNFAVNFKLIPNKKLKNKIIQCYIYESIVIHIDTYIFNINKLNIVSLQVNLVL